MYINNLVNVLHLRYRGSCAGVPPPLTRYMGRAHCPLQSRVTFGIVDKCKNWEYATASFTVLSEAASSYRVADYPTVTAKIEKGTDPKGVHVAHWLVFCK